MSIHTTTAETVEVLHRVIDTDVAVRVIVAPASDEGPLTEVILTREQASTLASDLLKTLDTATRVIIESLRKEATDGES